MSEASIGAKKISVLNEIRQGFCRPYGIGFSTMFLRDRIVEILADNEGLRPVDIAKWAGCSRGLVTQWMTGETKSMGYRFATKINQRTGYRVAWLMNGELPKRDEDWPGSSGWGKLPPDERRDWMQLLAGLTRKQRDRFKGDVLGLIEANKEIIGELGSEEIDSIEGKVRQTFAVNVRDTGKPRVVGFSGPVESDDDGGKRPKEKRKPTHRRPKNGEKRRAK
jgi:hypothetical protein